MEVSAGELETLEGSNKVIEQQLLIDTANVDLKRYEKEFGIRTNSDKTIAERRAIIKAKQLAVGTSTVKQIEAVCKSFVDNVEVIEHNAEGYFDINIIVNGELPYTLEALYKAVDDMQPAHLEAVFNIISMSNGKIHLGAINISSEKTTINPQEVNT